MGPNHYHTHQQFCRELALIAMCDDDESYSLSTTYWVLLFRTMTGKKLSSIVAQLR